MDYTPNITWLHGEHANAVIDTRLPYIHIFEPDMFVQGDDALEIITLIHAHWVASDCSVAESVEWWKAVHI